jgi:hypothetical protein
LEYLKNNHTYLVDDDLHKELNDEDDEEKVG